MQLIPSFLTKPLVEQARNIQNENESQLMDTTEIGYRAREIYDLAVRLELLLTLSPRQLWHRRKEVLCPNPAQYV